MKKLKPGQIINVTVAGKTVKSEFIRMNHEFYIVYPLHNPVHFGVKQTVVVNQSEVSL